MRTFLFVLVALVFLNLSMNAQNTETKPFKIGVGLMAGLPMGDYSDFANLAYGIDLQGEYTIKPAFALTLSGGYLNFISKGGGDLEVGSIPILAGAKYYFSDKFYGCAQVGLTFFTVSGGGSSFTFAPGIGYKINKNFDVLAKYQSATDDYDINISVLGIRAALSF